jgi:hypothetical protein
LVPDQQTIAAGLYALAFALLAYKGLRLYVVGERPEGPGKDWL